MSARTAQRGLTVKSDTRPYIFAGLAILLVLFGGLGTWAAVTPLRGAVVAPGVIVVETNRKTVQHLEGGIVEKLFVREGGLVRQGDVLIRMDASRVDSRLLVLDGQIAESRAQEARLVAEREGAAEITFPPDLVQRGSNPDVANSLRTERDLFEARRKAFEGTAKTLKDRISRLRERIPGLKAQRDAKTRQMAIIEKELRDLRGLYEKGLVPRPRLLALEREAERLQGERGQHVADIAGVRKGINETQSEISQRQESRLASVVTELREVQARLFELRDRRVSFEDERKRIEIRAPRSGRVVGLSVHTIGAVIAPGEELMDIVPEADRLVVEARLRPEDVDKVTPQMQANIRLSAFDLDRTPEVAGEVISVSADRLTDADSQLSYFAVRIGILATEMPKLKDLQLRAGMPAEVFIQTGSRTALSYLFKPFEDALHRVLIDS